MNGRNTLVAHRPESVPRFFGFLSQLLLVLLLAVTAMGQAFAGTFSVFGKETVTRENGAPAKSSYSFEVRDPSAKYELKIQNGILAEDKKKTKVSSASVAINNVKVLRPQDFNKNVSDLTRTVKLNNQNKIDIKLAGKPGSYLVAEVVGYDNVPPTIDATIKPLANKYGWHNGDVVVSFECSDKTSGIASCPDPVTLTLEGKGQVVSGTAVDVAGNKASTSVTVNIDLTKGLISSTVTPTPNAAGWNNADTTVTFNCSDALSGVASCSDPVLLVEESDAHNVVGEVVDKADNNATTSITVKLDKSAPTINVTPNPAANTHGWHNSPVSLQYSCSDDLSGIADCPPEQTIESEGAQQTFSAEAADVAGNTASAAIKLNIDRTIPTIVATVKPSANPAGWHHTDVTVSYNCADTLSGIQHCAALEVVSTEAASQVITGEATDNADNSASASVSLNIDKTAPQISASLEPLPNAAGWNKEAVLVRFQCSDELSGIASCPEPVTVELEGEGQTISGTAEDLAGNTASTSVNVNIDLTPGIINDEITPAPNAEGWNNADATVSFTCSDALSGVADCSEDQSLQQEGAEQTVTGTVTDVAGNTASTSLTLNIDKTAPQISTSLEPAPNAAGWNKEAVLVRFQCSDELSGIASCPEPVTVELEGEGQTISGTAEDLAGNTASISVNVNIDLTPGTISGEITPAPNAEGWNNADATVSFTCSDALSGVADCSEDQSLQQEGAEQTVTGTVTDVAGNTASTSLTLNIDKTAPLVTFVTPLQGSKQSENPPPVSIQLTDNLKLNNESLELFINGTKVTANCQLVDGVAQCTLPAYIEGDSATIRADVQDMAENKGSVSISFDFDNDGDGVIDAEDVFPEDPNEWADLDGDGTGDNSDPDRDGDGISNDYENQTGYDPNDGDAVPPDADGDGIPDSVDPDRDNDGVANDEDAFPDDPAESSDLDGDGTGDNADTDRDGDGFSNNEEEAEGTDPNSASDYPDHEAPTLTVDGPQERVTDLDTIELSGSVSDSGKGVALVKVLSDRYPGIDFAAVLTGDQWIASLPLEVDSNLLTIIAIDQADNQTTAQVKALRENANAVLGLSIDYPKTNAVVTANSIVVRGILRSSVPALEMAVQVNGKEATLSETDSVTEYSYQSPALTLAEGLNTILVQATIDGEPIQRSVYVNYQPEQEQVAPPTITVLAPQSGSYFAETDFILAGEVLAYGNLSSLTINGQSALFNSNEAPRYSFSELQNIPQDSSEGSYTIRATDELGQSSELTVSYYIDNTAPVITLQRPLNPAPDQNRVVEQPYRLQGTVYDPNIASVLVNDNSVALEPLDENGNYSFDVLLSLRAGEPNVLQLTASDMAGSRTTREYNLLLDTDISLTLLSPEQGAEYIHEGAPLTLSLNAQVDGITGQEGITITAEAVNTAGETVAAASLSGSASLVSGTLELPAESMDYRMVLSAKDSGGELLATTSSEISVIDEQDVPLAVSRIEPANGARGIEPNKPIAVYFNRAVDIGTLAIKVHETVHGYTYMDMDPPGADALSGKGYQLVEVNRDHEAVPGGLSLLPNNRAVVFYPSRPLAYNAALYVDVEVDGNAISRTQYHTRTLPTFIVGTVRDQLGQGVDGVTVTIPQLERTTRTNSEGAFTFGFGDTAAQNIPGGEYTLRINQGMKNRRYGSYHSSVSIQQGRRNDLPGITLPQLAQDVPFVPATGGDELTLLGGALKIDLSQAQLQFPDGRQSGDIHAQFTTYSQLPYRFDPIALPLWMYAIQPSGMRVEGEAAVDFACPPLNGSLDYVPVDGAYVLLLGLHPGSKTIAPVGVGLVEGRRIKSVGATHFETLAMIGYGLADMQAQPHLKDYAEGKLSLPALLLQIRQ